MATDSINIVDPYDSYEPYVQEDASGVAGDELLNSVAALQVGFGTQVLRIDRQGIWLGAETFASAPFSVDMAGNMTATSLDLSAYLEVGESLADIQALIGDLSDIDTSLGTITAGNLIGLTVTGGLIRTSTSGGRVEIDGTTDNIEVYDSSNVRRMELDQDELIFYDGNGSETGSLAALYSNIIGLTFPATKLGFVVYSGTTAKFAVAPSGSVFYDDVDFSNNNLLNCGNIEANDTTSDIGTATTQFDNLYIDDIFCDNDITITDGTLKVTAGFVRLAQMSGATADARSDDLVDGNMYYRTDDDVIRVRINGTWKSINVT